jgi:hypothetical protein
VKKLIEKIEKEYLSKYYSTPTPDLEKWTVVASAIEEKYGKKLSKSLPKKKLVKECLSEQVINYITKKLHDLDNTSDTSVEKALSKIYYSNFLATNFKSKTHDELNSSTHEGLYIEQFGVCKTYAYLANDQYPFTLIRSDFKNYTLKKYKQSPIQLLINALREGTFVATDELNQYWNYKLSHKFQCAKDDIPNLTKNTINDYKTNLAKVELYIRITQVLPPSALKELREIKQQFGSPEIDIPIDFNNLILNGSFSKQTEA